MYNFRKGRPQSVLNRMRFDSFDQSLHRKVLIIGSGESGFNFLSKMRWQWDFRAPEVGLITNQPVHRTRYGLPLYVAKYYLPIDFERPLLQDFKKNVFDFDEAIAVYPKEQVVQLFWGDYITYDNLILACGQEVDKSSLSEKFFSEAVEELTNVFDMSGFEGYKKLLKRFEFLADSNEIEIIAMTNSQQTEEAINLAILCRNIYPRNKVKLFLGQSAFETDAFTTVKLLNFLHRKQIEVISKRTVDESKVGDPNSKSEIEISHNNSAANHYKIVFPSKATPSFLADTPELLPQNFDLETLSNKEYSNVFGIGSFLFPECGFYEKLKQVDVAFRNFNRKIAKEWSDKEWPLARYQPHREMLIFDHFTKVCSLTETNFKDGLLGSKRRAWKLLNSEIFKHFYWTRLRPKHIKTT